MKKPLLFGVPAFVLLLLGTWVGMSLLRSPHNGSSAGTTQPAPQEFYTCPMHPSVNSDRPGSCPVCEMSLVKKTVTAEPVRRQAADRYTCPMHESVISDEPGACSICGMTLVEKSVQEDLESGDLSDLKEVSLSPMQRVMANVSTATVERRMIGGDIQAVGIVSYAEPNYRVISMRFAGRVERLFVTFAGQYIRKGDPVAEVYSPDVIADEQSYLRALDAYRATTRDGGESTDPVSNFLRQTREKLRQLGFTESQIADLGKSETLGSFVMIYSPISGTVVKKSVDPGRYYAEPGVPLFDVADLSTVWILLDVYEKDLHVVKRGLSVELTTEAYPLDKFKGRVVFVDPILTPETRTMRVRTEFPNPEGKLKPNMYVNATISVPQSHALVVPTTAILPAGKRSIVWVEKSENLFEPREVVVGPTNGGLTAILKGVREGENVVATGGFLIDSESALSWTGGDQPKNH